MASKFQQLFDQNVMRSMDKQKAMVDVHPQQQWEFDKPNCKLSLLESGVTFHVQILGMEDLKNNVWHWGWSEAMEDFPDSGRVAAKKMQWLGKKYEIPELTAGTIPMDQISAQDISIIASGVLKASCYWAVGQEEQFSLYMLIMPDQIQLQPDCSPTHLTMNIPQTIGAMEIHNHKRAIKSYLKDCGYVAQEAPGEIVAVHDGVPKISMSFDEMNRLTGLKASLSEGDAGEGDAGEGDAGEAVAVVEDAPAGVMADPGSVADSIEDAVGVEVAEGSMAEPVMDVATDAGEVVVDAGEAVVDAGQEAADAASPFGAIAAGAAGLGAAGLGGAAALANTAKDSAAAGIENATAALTPDVASAEGEFEPFSFGEEGAPDAAGLVPGEEGAAIAGPTGEVKKKSGLLKILLLLLAVFLLLAVIAWLVFTFWF